MTKIIFEFIALISLFLIPKRALGVFIRLKGYICTYRFFLSTHSSLATGYIRPPFYIKGEKYICIGQNFYSGHNLRIECWDKYGVDRYSPNICIGNNVCLNNNCHIGAINKIIIGNNVLIGSNVLITDHGHGNINEEDLLKHPSDRPLISKGPVIIDDDVWIGENVSILSGVHIERGSIIGANAVVVSDIPSYSVCGGNPAKIIKRFFID